jgi:hypothetical protein
LTRRYFVHGPTAKDGHDQRMVGLMMWPLIGSTARFTTNIADGAAHGSAARPEKPFRRRYQNIDAVLAEVDRLGIPPLP